MSREKENKWIQAKCVKILVVVCGLPQYGSQKHLLKRKEIGNDARGSAR